MLLQEEQQAEQDLMQAEQQLQQRQEEEAQMDYEAAEGGAMPPPPEGEMPQDPLMAEQAQERLQGGPDGREIQQRELAENAPQ